MGARLYSPTTGRFLQIDPIAGGSANAYDRCNADPVNCTDLDGTWPWKSIIKAVAVVSEIASMVPGPVGTATSVVSAGAYLALGDKKKALWAAGRAALNLAGVGAIATVGVRALKVAKRAEAFMSEARQLQHFVSREHHEAFGIVGNFSKKTSAATESALRGHLGRFSTISWSGTYRGKTPVKFNYNILSRSILAKGRKGELVTGFKPTAGQLRRPIFKRSIGIS